MVPLVQRALTAADADAAKRISVRAAPADDATLLPEAEALATVGRARSGGPRGLVLRWLSNERKSLSCVVSRPLETSEYAGN